MIERTPRPVLPEPDPGDPGWFKTVEQAVAQDPAEHARFVQQVVMGGHRLTAARDVYHTFPHDFDRYQDLRWVDLLRDFERCDEVWTWMEAQTWHGHIGFGWIDDIRGHAGTQGCFGLFDDERDAVFFKIRWWG